MAKTNYDLNTGLAFQRTSEFSLSLELKDFCSNCLHIHRVDELYRFLNAWVQHLYGELDEEAIKTRGFELIQHDTEWSNNRSSSKVSWTESVMSVSLWFNHFFVSLQDGCEITDEIQEYTRESWEVSQSFYPFKSNFLSYIEFRIFFHLSNQLRFICLF